MTPDLPAYDGSLRARLAHSKFLALLARVGSRGLPGDAPTAASLERHARRFGSEEVVETAAGYGLTVAVQRPAGRRATSSGPTLRQRVATLVADGHGVEVIAEMEDLSPARARRLVAEVKEKA